MKKRWYIVALLSVILTASPAGATAWVFDSVNGNDGGAGSAASPWKSWGKFVNAINGLTIKGDDTVTFKSGRYAACIGLSGPNQSLDGPGGSVGHPLTVSVDTSTAGNVEIHGGARSGICGVPAWTQALSCTAGDIGAVCNTLGSNTTECGAGGVCSTLTGVYWTVAAADNGSSNYFGGFMGGVAYQPSTTPGGAPKIFERLYSQAGSSQVKMPTWTAGHAQMMPYPTLPGTWSGLNACTAARVPWYCCTGAGAGTCTNSRIFVQMENGLSPDDASNTTDPNFGPVEFPIMPMLINNASTTTPVLQSVTFTNNNNGRKFYFRWGITGIFLFKNADTINFEDIDIGYTSRAWAQAHLFQTGSANASNFPPYNSGDTYLITGWNDAGSNVVRNFGIRRGAVHGTQGNESMHFIGGPSARFNTITWENLELGDDPFAVPDGFSGTNLTPNANTNQVNKSWPPPGYGAWASLFPTHWGPLGGGANTDGQLITTTFGQTIRNCYFHDGGLISFFEGGGAGNLLFENNWVDLARMFYADGGHFPAMLVGFCGGTGGCGALDGKLALSLPTRFRDATAHGVIVRNNVFDNVYSNAIRTGSFKNGCTEAAAPFKPATPGMIVNNTFHVKGDERTTTFQAPTIYFWDVPQTCIGGSSCGSPCTSNANCPGGTCDIPWTMDAADGSKFVFKNNIIARDTPSTATPKIATLGIDPRMMSQVDIDYNNYGGQNVIWQGSTQYNTFAAWQTAIQTCSGCTATNESHTLNADPQFVLPYTNLSILFASPDFQTGIDLSTFGPLPFSWDYLNVSRPLGLWSSGAYQSSAGGGNTTTTIVGPTSTTSTSTSTTVSTTIGGGRNIAIGVYLRP